jgi:aldose sugar dehydrogenase
MTIHSLLRAFTVCSLASVAWAASPDSAREAETGRTPQLSNFTDELERPWGMEFMPDGRLLVTERPGRLRVVSADGREISPPVDGVPKVDYRDLGGLLDVTIDPSFADNRFIYLSFTKKSGRGAAPGRNSLTVARARLSDDATRLEQYRVLFRQTPVVVNSENLGGRLAVSEDGYLFLTVGDRHAPQDRMRAQSLAYYQGKIVRLRIDGAVPADNPFVHSGGARPEIWSLGHRNPGGAFVHPRTQQLWISEHGPQGGDEINVVRKGANYGWPVITYGCEYVTCDNIGEGTHKAGMEQPLTFWGRPGVAPSNLILYSGGQFPQWEGNLFVGTMADRSVWRIELAGDDKEPQVKRREQLFTQLGERIRDIRQGPDGGLYLLTDGERGRVVRVAAQNSAH